MGTGRPRGPLAGVRVLDHAEPLGWYCTKLLADLGADVLRIEPPGGDPARDRPPTLSNGNSLAYWYFNTSKRSISIDCDTPAGQEDFRALAESADIVVETRSPRYLTERGLASADLLTANHGLIWTAIRPFGLSGPLADWLANDLVLQAAGGLMFLAGVPGRPPSQLGGNQAEYLAGVMGACATLLALFERERTGRGQLLDISGQAAVSIDGENALPYWDVERWERPRLGERNYRGLRQLFPAKDGWVILSLGSRWRPFRAWLEQVGLLTDDLADPKWESQEYRSQHPDELERICAELCARQTRTEIYEAGQRARVGVGPIYRLDEQFNDPQLATRGFWCSVPHPELERAITYPGAPFRLSATPWSISRPPLPGEHNGQGWLDAEPRRSRQNLKSGVGEPSFAAVLDSYSPARVLAPSRPRPPLDGIRVIDLSWVAAGPLATRQLADHGAEVIKVETHVHPDSSRTLSTARPAGNSSLNVSGMWNNLNTSKRSIALDLRKPGAFAILEDLIRVADVLVDNYGVDPYPKWGLTPERIRRLNPDLIVARSSVMGRSGPRQQYIGFGYTIAAAAGHNSVTGFPEDPPAGACIAHPDYSCNPFHLTVAILAALRHRALTGEGQTIDLAQHESTLAWLGPELMAYANAGKLIGPAANRRADCAPHGAYRTAGDDCWIALSCETDDQFQALATALGVAELATDARFRTLGDRKSHEELLDERIAPLIARHKAQQLAQALQQAGVPASAVLSHRELIESDPQMRSRGHYRTAEHPEAGNRLVDGPAFRLTRSPGWIRRPAPMLGEHTDWVVGSLLGFDEDRISEGYVDEWFH